MKLVFISDINVKDSPHVRDCINEATAEDYAEDMKSKQKFPPVILFTNDNRNIFVGDGMHRIRAHSMLKHKAIEADVRKGGYDEALLFALAANNKHGQRRTAEDRRAGVREALKRWPDRTDNYLAEVCFVSNHLVAEVRQTLVVHADIPHVTTRVGKDGRSVPVTKESPVVGTKPKPEKEVEHLDDTGWPIPKQLLPMWERNAEVQMILTQLSQFKGVLARAQQSEDPLWGEVLFSNAISDLQKVYENIATAKGYAVCHVCAGRPDIQPKKCCPTCKSKGLLSRFRWNTVVPSEIKKIRQQQTKRT